jgi:hypothetical protein
MQPAQGSCKVFCKKSLIDPGRAVLANRSSQPSRRNPGHEEAIDFLASLFLAPQFKLL